MPKQGVLILGATSEIAEKLAYLYAAEGRNIYLLARNAERLENLGKDLEIRYEINVKIIELDALDFNSFERTLLPLAKHIDTLICLWGCMFSQKESETNKRVFVDMINVNFIAPALALNIIANEFETQKKGSIIGISSVAGLRGRRQNYTYGSSKAAFTCYLSGLRNRLHQSFVHVMTVLPGYIDTKMIASIKTPKPLTISPEKAAISIYKAHKKRKNIIYLYPIWRYIMMIIIHIPEYIFKRLNI